jgi:ATP-dependent DNA helicase PIF1
MVRSDERFLQVKQNIISTDVLIIDEIPMISSKLLSQVEHLCRNLRNNTCIFGGIQMVLVGDFYQLPPVPNALYGDNGRYCFTAPFFQNGFPHIVQLCCIHRQSDSDLITCINELETGNLSDTSVAFLYSLSRPIRNQDEAVQLFARNFDVDVFNHKKVQHMSGELKYTILKMRGLSITCQSF